VQQHAQILAPDAELAAHRVFVPLVQKDCLKDLAVPLRKLSKQGSHVSEALFGNEFRFHSRARTPKVCSLVIQLGGAALLAEVLEDDVIADRVHISAKPLRLVESGALPQRPEHAEKNLLAKVLHILRRPETRAQLNEKQAGEIVHEVLLSLRVAVGKAPDILPIKSEKLADWSGFTFPGAPPWRGTG
jgi:hypothetical protein